MISGSARITLYLKRNLDLPLLAKELAKNGLWVADILPKADGTFEILSPEPLMIAFKLSERGDVPSYKLYATPDATSLTIFSNIDTLKENLAEVIAMLQEVGYMEDEIQLAELSTAIEDELKLCNLASLKTEFFGELVINGVASVLGNKAFTVVPLNLEKGTYLVTITVRGEWGEVRRHALALRPLYEELKEVMEKWSCRE